MNRRVAALTCLILAVAFLPVSATSVVAPTFAELVRESETVFVGQVLTVQPRAVQRRGHDTVVTDVVFRTLQTIKGPDTPQHLLEFAGGRLGDQELRIEGIPQFAPGDRSVLFVANTAIPTLSPLIGVMWGRFRISGGTDGTSYILQHDGTPFNDTNRIGPATTRQSGVPIVPMRLERFLRSIDDELRRQR